jgi:hypothetical protein
MKYYFMDQNLDITKVFGHYITQVPTQFSVAWQKRLQRVGGFTASLRLLIQKGKNVPFVVLCLDFPNPNLQESSIHIKAAFSLPLCNH